MTTWLLSFSEDIELGRLVTGTEWDRVKVPRKWERAIELEVAGIFPSPGNYTFSFPTKSREVSQRRRKRGNEVWILKEWKYIWKRGGNSHIDISSWLLIKRREELLELDSKFMDFRIQLKTALKIWNSVNSPRADNRLFSRSRQFLYRVKRLILGCFDSDLVWLVADKRASEDFDIGVLWFRVELVADERALEESFTRSWMGAAVSWEQPISAKPLSTFFQPTHEYTPSRQYAGRADFSEASAG